MHTSCIHKFIFKNKSTLSKATFSNYLSYLTVFEDEEKKCCNVKLLKCFKNTDYIIISLYHYSEVSFKQCMLDNSFKYDKI